MPTTTKAKKSKSKSRKKKPEVPYHRKPDNLSLDEWQAALRKQFAQMQHFNIENVGVEPVFSDFEVHNPQSENTYKVAIRSNLKQIQEGQNQNFCSCYDFKTNGLGTCKHIESVLLHISKKRELKKIITRETFNPPYSSVYLKYSPQKRIVKLRIGSFNAPKFKSFRKLYFTNDGTLKDSSFDKFDLLLDEAREIDPGFRCYEDALSYIITIREKRRRMDWVDRNKKELQENRLSDYIQADLHPYQKEGVCFAIVAGRVMIADEMGLGKTLQAIAAAEVFKKEFGIQKTLVVCPTSLKYQWKSEIEKFTDTSVQVIEGNPLKRAAQYADDNYFYKIASHHTIGNDLETINRQEFDLIILDEAQRIKNWKTKISQNIKKLDSPYAIVLSGTPLENKLEELYSVVQFIDRFRLGALFRFLYNHQVCDPETGKVIGYKDLNQVGKILSDIMIRRTKKKVLRQLPS
ncbi:MAG: SNF2-related protein, partial [Cyclobacteriaceae bacterium]